MPHLVVVGEGVAKGVPDQCILQAGLNVIAESPAEAVARVGVVASQVRDSLAEQGIDPADLRTTHLGVQDFIDPAKQQVTARIGSYHLEIIVHDLGQIGELLASLVAVAADSFQIRALQLAVGDPEPLRREARRQAVEDARRRADQLAEAAEIRLGRILSVEQDYSPVPGQPWGFARRGSAPIGAVPPIPIEPGNLSVTERVTLTYEVE
jgi:uncharacterized protein